MAAEVKKARVHDPDARDLLCIFTVATVDKLHSDYTRAFRQPGFLSMLVMLV